MSDTTNQQINDVVAMLDGFMARGGGHMNVEFDDPSSTVKEVEEMFKEDMIEVLYLPEAFAAAMGDVAIVAKFTSPARRDEFFKTALRRKDRL